MNLLLLLAAHAEPVFRDTGFFSPCESGVEPVSTIPSPGTQNVPFDLQPVLAVLPQCGTVVPPYVVTLRQDNEVLHQEIRDSSNVSDRHGPIEFYSMNLPELTPETSYELEIRPEIGVVIDIPFRTGTARAQPSSGLPNASLTQLTTEGRLVNATVAIEAAGPWEFTILRTNGVARNPLAETSSTTLFIENVQGDRELCVSAVSRSLDGRFVGPSEASCRPIPRTCGCTQNGPSGSVLWLGGLWCLALRRR